MSALREEAAARDAADPLAAFRARFVLDDDLVYLDGNSLGRLPSSTPGAVAALIEREWSTDLVMGWERWIDMAVDAGDLLAPVIGASAGEVAVCDQTSINLYKLAMAALAESGRRGRPNIVTDEGNFPSDRYVLESVAASHGGAVVYVPEDPSIDDLAGVLDDGVGLLSLSHVAYRSGMMHDGGAVTALAHDAGAYVLWDLAHSAGSVPVHVDAWHADLAVGCTYKYLNGGPGAPGYVFVRSDLQDTLEQPIRGWFSHADQFAMAQAYRPSASIRRFTVGTPPLLSLVAAMEGIKLTVEAGTDTIRSKSIDLTETFLSALDEAALDGVTVVTPRDPNQRGSHVAVTHPEARRLSVALRDDGVIVDFRTPDIIRFGFAPLYTTHTEAVTAAEALAAAVASRAWSRFGEDGRKVT